MIEKNAAIKIQRHALDAIKSLSAAPSASDNRCSPEEFQQIKRGVGLSIGRIEAVDGSASICSISVAKLKKVSALRKKSFVGLRIDLTKWIYLHRSDSDARVENRKLIVPPSGLKPHAIAMASRIVD